MSHAYAFYLTGIGLRTLLVFAWLVLGLRFLGKRHMGQMNIYDLVLIMMLANGVQNAMTAGTGNLSAGLLSAAVLLLAARGLVFFFLRHPQAERVLAGSPTPLIVDGRVSRENLRHEMITREQLMAALREHGVSDPSEVHIAVLEVDGDISVVTKREKKR